MRGPGAHLLRRWIRILCRSLWISRSFNLNRVRRIESGVFSARFREFDAKHASLQNPRLYQVNDAIEIILPTKSTPITPPFLRCQVDRLWPDTPSPPTYYSFLHIIDYSETTHRDSTIDIHLDFDGSNSGSIPDFIPSPASRCMVIEEVSASYHQCFNASSSHTFGSPGDFDESSVLNRSFSSPAVGFDISPAAESTHCFNQGSSQAFGGDPGYQWSFEGTVLDDIPLAPSTSAFGCAMGTPELLKPVFLSSCSPTPATVHRKIGVRDFCVKKVLGNGAFGDVYLT
ncbi:hypothetical protein BD410DRAFT_139072 [Rickenella mellea]|uniref:Protein kinase domain-containing protein n=1 Tax=Rickenella mellea TaxID=50990 RepID=A0A4Y7PJ24_9AGAM|nr:hypothetical protein BD410DRAFT_139072 [Rickenella mellea]